MGVELDSLNGITCEQQDRNIRTFIGVKEDVKIRIANATSKDAHKGRIKIYRYKENKTEQQHDKGLHKPTQT